MYALCSEKQMKRLFFVKNLKNDCSDLFLTKEDNQENTFLCKKR